MKDRDFIRRGLMAADLDAVKVALFHNSRDTSLAELPTAAQMSEEQRQDLIDRAADWLALHASTAQLPQPSAQDLRAMMEIALGAPMGDLEFAARSEIPGFNDFPYFARWEGERPAIPADFKVAIIGSGFAGITMAVQLDQLGIPNFLLERRPEAGGVWSINRYPDVRVDTISVTYEIGFDKDVSWREYFGRGEDVRRHLDSVSRKFGVHDRTLFDHDVTEARFDAPTGLWRLTVSTPDGVREMSANALVTCSGLFATPNLVSFEGQESFAGDIVHTARWPDDLDLAGRNIAIIGNGSTGVQMLGSLARQAAHVDVYQRTPQWISPRENYGAAIGEEYAWVIAHFPGYRNWWRLTATAPVFDTHKLMQADPEWQAQGGLINEGNDAMRRALTDYIVEQTGGRQDLIDRLIPDYAPIARRPVVDNGWYAALTRDNVDLVTTPIARLRPEGIETADGVLHPCDLIVTATGYQVSQYLAPMRVKGAQGQDLHDEWAAGDGARAYLGLMHAGYPNFFTIYGPNSQPVSGGPAQPVWFAVWSSFAARMIMGMIEQRKSQVDVRREAYDRYNAALDAEAATLMLMTKEGGADKNYYLNGKSGRLQVNAPWYSPDYHRMLTQIDWQAVAFSGDLGDSPAAGREEEMAD